MNFRGTLAAGLAAVLSVATIAHAQNLTISHRDNRRAIGSSRGDDDALFRRTAAPVLAREFPSADINYLLLDIKTRAFIAKRWGSADTLIPVGSLVKPFTAIAYAETHEFQYPEFACTPGACWYPQGHGKMDIVRATAFSCNAYFIHLASEVSATQVKTVARRFGLNGPGQSASADAMSGRFGVWQETPAALANAYAELLARREQPGTREIVRGMAMSAREGTAIGIAHQKPKSAALAKTGTAPCTHPDHQPGDGFVILAWPAEAPQYLLLVRYHGNPGAHAAIVAGKMLKALQP
jgi:cell division protein FtsI/penicillin-binding protein 2